MDNGNNPPARTLNLEFSDEKQKIIKYWPYAGIMLDAFSYTYYAQNNAGIIGWSLQPIGQGKNLTGFQGILNF